MLDLKNKIEAIIFLSKEPVTLYELIKHFKLEREKIQSAERQNREKNAASIYTSKINKN